MKNEDTPPIILASQSPARLQLLKQIAVIPDEVIPANIDETEIKGETARNIPTGRHKKPC